MTLFDAADALLRDALIVTAHARPLDGHDRILPGDEFVSTVTVENQGLGDGAGTAARTAFLDVVARVEATPFAAPLGEDGEPISELTLELGELIFGEAASRELRMRATAAMDGPEPFARVHAHGRLDLDRFFLAASVHQFTTEIRREQAQDPAAEALRRQLLVEVLPEGFSLCCWSFDFPDSDDFIELVDDPVRFRVFVRERVIELALARGVAQEAAQAVAGLLNELFVDVHETGATGSLALALWFMGFDQGESFAAADVIDVVGGYLSAFDTWDERREVRVFKGFENDGVLADPVTVTDLPVIVDHGAQTITLWAGSLRG